MGTRKKFLFVLLLVLITSFSSVGLSSDSAVNSQEMILLTVDKATMVAELRTWPENTDESKLLKSFTIAIGKAKGDKTVEGDNKTPEGIYFSQKHINEKTLLKSKYGPHAIPVDFPNLMDRYDGKTGHGIWLHGAGDDARIAKTNVTEGCVAFYNNDIRRLSSWLSPYQSVVVIASDKKLVNKPEELKEVMNLTKTWHKNWANKDIEGYISHYHQDFKGQGRRLSAYKKYKKRVFSSYNKMIVNMTNIRIVSHPKYAVSIMNQDFSGDNRYKSEGRKILFWKKNNLGNWKILREKYEHRRYLPLEFSKADLNKLEEGELPPASPSKQSSLPSISSSKS